MKRMLVRNQRSLTTNNWQTIAKIIRNVEIPDNHKQKLVTAFSEWLYYNSPTFVPKNFKEMVLGLQRETTKTEENSGKGL